ncbi:4Fe-4S ferredoxin [Pseudoflavonifractor sp. AF19-9AC]|uniref:EFR1 family ferrodoxin n=1 Tax=Pseudoflavonifractor sp. AF19-9AC TaxID=2292244 RepID=UPI000E5403FA|nr:EFR1 family ferrodoxin [Pseudoflavonifractor sp. AF19-9AC]RHR10065.1 4Fe-4S ferredoxin [Pseudoflavonifractor sp. AF19-9AC]
MSLYKIMFSPTGGTDKVAEPFVQAFDQEPKTIDLTDCTVDFHQISLAEEDTCIVAVPSFGGRVPEIAASRLEQIRANGAKAILIVAYGNRAYDDTLLELKTILRNSGFCCAAAVAAAAEHSIMHQYAKGRPNQNDLEELSQFAKQSCQRIEEGKIPENLDLPGSSPYREYHGVPIKPVTEKNCTKCGLCAKKCPVQAISLTNPFETDGKKCISCMRCVSICPVHARSINKIMAAIAASKLKKAAVHPRKMSCFLEYNSAV